MTDAFLTIIRLYIVTFFLIFNIYILDLLKINFRDVLMISAINFVISYPTILFKIQVIGLPVLLLSTFIIIYIKTKEILLNIVSIIVTYIISIGSDMICGYICVNILGISPHKIITNSLYGITFTIIIYLISFLVIKLISYIINKIKINRLIIKSKITIVAIINLLTVLVLLYINSMINRYMNTNRVIISLNSALFIVYFLTTIIISIIYGKSIINQITYENKHKEFQQLEEYTNSLENMYNDMRKFKHDYINILSTINGYIEEDNLHDLKEFFNKKIIPMSEEITKKNMKLGLLQHIKVAGVKGLMSSKIIRGQALGIEMYIDIVEDIENINMDIIDLCRILGIVFDNAIEAAVEHNNPFIRFGIIKKKSLIMIVIKNSCTLDTPPVYKVFKEGFSTKGKGRGIGLHTVKQIISGYDNAILNTIIDNEEFIQELEIKQN